MKEEDAFSVHECRSETTFRHSFLVDREIEATGSLAAAVSQGDSLPQ